MITTTDKWNILLADAGNLGEVCGKMVAQCKHMHDNPPKGYCCGTLRKYRDRWLDKARHHIETFEKSLANEQIGCDNPSNNNGE